MYRSRRQQVEEKNNFKKALMLALVAVVLIIAIGIWGLPLLVKLAVLVGDLNSDKQANSFKDNIPPAPPRIILSTVATNSADFRVSGWAEPEVVVYLMQNTDDIGSINTKSDGKFEIDTKLSEGKNSFIAVAMDKAGNKSQPSDIVNVEYSNKVPTIEIEKPKDGQTFSGKDNIVEIAGKTDPGSRLVINGRIVILAQDGRFNSKFQLNPGENLFTITSTNKVGGQSTIELSLNYQQ